MKRLIRAKTYKGDYEACFTLAILEINRELNKEPKKINKLDLLLVVVTVLIMLMINGVVGTLDTNLLKVLGLLANAVVGLSIGEHLRENTL